MGRAAMTALGIAAEMGELEIALDVGASSSEGNDVVEANLSGADAAATDATTPVCSGDDRIEVNRSAHNLSQSGSAPLLASSPNGTVYASTLTSMKFPAEAAPLAATRCTTVITRSSANNPFALIAFIKPIARAASSARRPAPVLSATLAALPSMGRCFANIASSATSARSRITAGFTWLSRALAHTSIIAPKGGVVRCP